MKKITLFLAFLACTLSLRAGQIVYPVTANVVSNLFVGGKIIESLTATATSTNITTFRFYDSANTSTTYVQQAYGQLASYSTNITTIFTNEAGLLITNNVVGRWTYTTTVAIATNNRPIKATLVVPAGLQRTSEIVRSATLGLNVIPNFDGIVEVTYRDNP